MNWMWRNVYFDPETDMLIQGKLYNYCSACKQKTSFVFFPFLVGQANIPQWHILWMLCYGFHRFSDLEIAAKLGNLSS